MNLVRRVAGVAAIAVSPRPSVASAWRLLAASLLFVVALLGVSLGVASPALAAPPTAGNFGPGGTLYNEGSNPPLVFSVLPHVTGGATSFAMVSAASDMGGTVSITNAGTITYIPPVGFKGTDWVYYTASNADGTSPPATVHISVNWPNIAVALPSNFGQVGVPYNPGATPIAISGGHAPYTITFSDPLPDGLSYNAATRVVSGTPTDAGGFSVNYTVSDSSYGPTGNQVDNRSFTFSIAAPTITLSPPTLPGAAIGAAYSQTLTASGGAGPYSYAVTAGALPAGLTLSPAGVLSGTPTAAGAFNVTVRAMDSAFYTGSQAYALTVAAPPMTASPGALPGGALGTPYTASVTGSGATAPYSYQVTAGALPAGLSLATSGANAGTISGTPSAGGTFNFTISVTDSSTGTNAPFTVGRIYAVVITAPTVTVSPAGLPGGQIGQAYNTGITASGAQAPYTFAVTAGALPAGLSLSPGGTLTGTPTAAGTFNVTITATDSAGFPATGSRAYSVQIVAPNLTLQPGIVPNAAFGEAYSMSFTAGGGSTPYSYQVTAGALPAGVTLSPAGVLSGTPTTLGTFNFTVTTTDATTGAGPYSLARAYALLVTLPPPPIAGPGALTLAANSPGEPVVVTLSGGIATSLAVGAVTPAHGTLNIAGLTMTYVPDPGYSGPDSFTYTAGNITGHSAEETVSITVTPPTLTLSALPTTGQVAASYSGTATASLGTAPYSFVRTAGALPEGVTLAADGTLSGTATAAGTFNFTLQATDAYGATGSQAYAVTIDAPTVAITAPAAGALPGVEAGTAYSQSFTATGGQGAHGFTVTAGALPPGLTLSVGGVLSGTPTASGTFNFSVTPQDSSGAPGPYLGAPRTYSLTVAAPTIAVTPPSLPAAATATAYSATLVASGGVGAYDYAVTAGALPAGLSLGAGGALSGTLTASGTFNFTVTATDSLGFTGTRAFSVTVSDPVIAVTAPAAGALPAGQGGVAYSQTFTATGGQGSRSFILVGGALPAGLSLSSGGVLSGTPTASGAFSFSIRATDASPAPGPFSSPAVIYTLQIAAPTIVVSPATGALPGGLITVPYNQAVTASGGAAPYGFAVTAGALPGGLTLSAAGALSGTPTLAGSYGFSVVATDAFGFNQTAAYTLEIGTPIPVVTAKTATLIAGQSVTIDATAGATGTPFTAVTVTTAPSHGTAVISGLTIVYTADAAYTGPDSFAYSLTNAGGPSLPATVSITVNPAIVAGPPKTVTILAGQTATVELTEGATGAPFTGAAVVSLSPADAGTATITGRTGPAGQLYDLIFKPDNAFTGQAVVTYTLNNAFATSAPGTVTITVEPRPDPTADPEVSALIAAQTDTARRFATAQVSNINRRLERLHGGGAGGEGGFSSSLGFSGGNSALGGGLASDPSELRRMQDSFGVIGALTGGRGLGFDGGAPAARAEDSRAYPGSGYGAGSGPWSVWLSGAVNFGTSDAAANREGIEFDTDGLTIGADRRLGDRLVIGVAVGWAHDVSEIGDNGTRSEADAWSLSLYGSYQPTKAAFVDAVLGYGQLDFDSRRYVTANGDFAYGQRDGGQWYGALTAGWDYSHPQGLRLSPYGRIEASRSTLDAFTEEGGGIFALHYDEQATTTVIGAVGLKGDYALKTGFGQAIPSFRIEYAYDLKGSGAARIRYADWLDGNVYSMTSTPYGKNRMLYGLGLDLLRKSGLRFGLDYAGMLSDDQTGHTVRILLQTPF